MVAVNARWLSQVPSRPGVPLAPNPTGFSASAHRLAHKSAKPRYKMNPGTRALPHDEGNMPLHQSPGDQDTQSLAQSLSEVLALLKQNSQQLASINSKLDVIATCATQMSSLAVKLEAIERRIDTLASVRTSTRPDDSLESAVSELSSGSQGHQDTMAQYSPKVQGLSKEQALKLASMYSRLDEMFKILNQMSTSTPSLDPFSSTTDTQAVPSRADIDDDTWHYIEDRHWHTGEAVKWFIHEKGFIVEHRLPEDLLKFIDIHNQPVVSWDDVFMVVKDDTRILVLVVAESLEFLSQEELLELPGKIQKTKHYLQTLDQNQPTSDSPSAYLCLYNYIKFLTDFTQVVAVVGTPDVDNELLQFADAHGVLVMRREGWQCVMQPTKLVS